ncbi:MAG: phosphoribosylglycinamide formyltransferase [Gammaproteobacteria bacterium]|nr:phosphoribosylglycinamide formyltransferase [Gammaproteobacteria bacterium]
MKSASTSLPVVILISGSGSNLQVFIDAQHAGTLPIEIKAVISNRQQAYGLQRAQQAGIHNEWLDHTAYSSREDFDAELQRRIDVHQPALVILAGFMRILSERFVNHYAGRMLNIHPSLLPKFRGLHTHQQALNADESEHGSSVHFVTAELDGGPVVLQASVPVEANDTADSLAQRVLVQEHQIYPLVVMWFAQGRLSCKPELRLDGQVLPQALRFNPRMIANETLQDETPQA